MKKEIWKAIKGFEGFYEVSTYGRVRSLDRTVYFKNGKGKRDYKGKILKQKYHNGYAYVNLNKNKELNVCAVHVLVAKAFIPNPNGYKVVNHKSMIKSDNNVENLEWCTTAYNNEHARINGEYKPNMEGFQRINNENKIHLSCYRNGKFITTKDCSRAMAKYLIEHKFVNSTSIETVARAIRTYSSIGKPYYGMTFIRHNEPKYIYKEEGHIDVIKNNVVLSSHQTSKECAIWLMEEGLVENTSVKTLARSIRKAIKDNRTYHKLIFKRVDETPRIAGE